MNIGDSQTLRQIVAKNIRRERLRANLSQESLAHKAEIHRTYIGAVERGEKNISIDSLEKIAAALQINPSELMERGHDEAAS
jgi:transcriptional regulator with XRE-family HTH domain